jgi:competence protein ComEC
VRLASRTDGDRPAPGDRIRVLARLGPPQPPLFPGGYDFARSAWFNRIGGVGFTLGRIDRLAAADPPGARLAARIAVERFRADVSDRIRTILPGDAGAIAAALIVGDRGAIDPETDEAMRISGLSHVLSISGLHMALVSACLYGGLRAALALVPFVALRLPIKQIAAAAALAGTAGYLVMAGMSLATQRSAVMIAIALLAVFVGRQPFSLRAVAVAALIVMAFSPQAVLDPGAQMSFAAVTALIAGYEALAASRQPPGPGDVNVVVRWTRGAGRWIGLSLYTSLLAGLATAPIAIHHFNRSAPLGLVANLLATPLVSVVIMPAGLVAALAMPVGLDSWPLALMGAGIDGMVAIARIVADWTPGGGTVGRPPLAGTMLVVSGGVWLCLWTRRARRPGWLLMAAGIAVSLTGERPDLVVAGDGRRALLALDGARPVLVGRADDFETGIWLAAMGDPRRPDDPSLVTRTRCDPEACILEPDERADDAADDRGSANGADAGNGGTPRSATVAVVFRPAAFADECGASDILIAAIPAPDWCRQYSVVIDARELAESGARTYRIIRDPDTAAGVRLEEIARALPRPRRPFDIGRP